MRFLGPRSISSLLKTALDVVYYGLFSVVISLAIIILALISVPTLAKNVLLHIATLAPLAQSLHIVTVALILLAYGISLSGYLVVMALTRQVFLTLAEGNVFHSDNTRRLRLMGFCLGGVEIFGYATRLFTEKVMHVPLGTGYGLRTVSAWFSILVVFVLAEVFREGAKLRKEADLTI